MLQSEAAAGEASGGKIVVYTTSVSTVKETYAACQDVRKMLQRARVAFEERDIFLHSQFAKELQARLPAITLPFVFFNGQPLGVCTAPPPSPALTAAGRAHDAAAQRERRPRQALPGHARLSHFARLWICSCGRDGRLAADKGQ